MEAMKLCKSLNISHYKIDRIALRTHICYDDRNETNKEYLLSIFRQIAINLHYIYKDFDLMSIEDIDKIARKNGVMCFMGSLYEKTTNREKKALYIERNMRTEAKSKLLYIQNNLLMFVNHNSINL